VSHAQDGKDQVVAIAPSLRHTLLSCDGFRVVSADARIGSVEEVWLGDDGDPVGLAIRTAAGQRGLVLADDVAAVDAEHCWVVVDPDVRILELEPPRLVQPSPDGRLEAIWPTNGDTLAVRPPPRPPRPEPNRTADLPLVRSIVVLYAGIAIVVTVVMTLAFVIPYLFA
jgi:hypothetical protein